MLPEREKALSDVAIYGSHGRARRLTFRQLVLCDIRAEGELDLFMPAKGVGCQGSKGSEDEVDGYGR